MGTRARLAALFAIALTAVSCQTDSHFQNANVLSYVSPESPAQTGEGAAPSLRFPLSVGVAFTPGEYQAGSALTEAVKAELAANLGNVLKSDPRFTPVVIIPSGYVRPGGGFGNLDEIRENFSVDAILLVSYDQVGYTGQGASTFLYLTIIGAYLVPGEKNATETLLEAALYHIGDRALLLTANGSSKVDSTATPIGSGKARREDAGAGLKEAAENLAVNLRGQLTAFAPAVEKAP